VDVPIFSKVIPGKKVATFFQIERRIQGIIGLQLSSQLPPVQSQESPPLSRRIRQSYRSGRTDQARITLCHESGAEGESGQRRLSSDSHPSRCSGMMAGGWKCGIMPRMKPFHRCWLAVLLAICVAVPFLGRANPPADAFTPLVVSALTPNTGIFLGTDGRLHLVYELVLTNANAIPATLKKLEVFNASDTSKVLASFEGADLLSRLRTTGNTRSESPVIEFNGTRLFLINFSIEATSKIPDRLTHHIELLGGGTPGTKPGTAMELSYSVAPVHVIQNLTRIGPPLAGKGWVAVNGCCGVTGVHRSTGLPINGRIYFAQRYAIDWMQLDKDGRMVHGDASDVNNYTDYGADVLAIANGKVVSALDTLDDQKPGTLPDPSTINLENADGNHVILDIGDGLYAMYAHMQKGSLQVKPGDFVKRGQVLGKLGNTGNTSGPHLHFQIMGGASALGSNGVPYILDAFTLEGQVSEAQYEAAPGVEGVWNQGMLPTPSDRHGQFPLNLAIVEFPEGK
jgi:hypothetical protein